MTLPEGVRPDMPERLVKVYKSLEQAGVPVGFDVMSLKEGVNAAPDVVDAPADYSLLAAIPSRHLFDEQQRDGVQLISIQPVYSFVTNKAGKPLVEHDLIVQFATEYRDELKDLPISVYKLEGPLFVSNRAVMMPERVLGFRDPVLYKQFLDWLAMAVFLDNDGVSRVRQFRVRYGTRKIPMPGHIDKWLEIKLAMVFGEGSIPMPYLDGYGQFHIDY